MARYEIKRILIVALLGCTLCCQLVFAKRSNAERLTACQHLRRAEARRSKALQTVGTIVRVPKCNKLGGFESVQCTNFRNGTDCWCVDAYGLEIPGTRKDKRSNVECLEPANCSSSSCRMFCPSGFARDLKTGCSICKCRDPCEGIACPGGQQCQLQEVQCANEPCPPVPTCKKGRNLFSFCPAGQPLSVSGSIRPFLCGTSPGKPECPPLYECLVEGGNDYGVCCPNSANYNKPGTCPKFEPSFCGQTCTHDLECGQMEKCCYSKMCQFTCQSPHNVTVCHQARALSEILSVSDIEGRGYIPDCNGPGGIYSLKQCSRNGIVCWCVDSQTGHKIPNTMGPANLVHCKETMLEGSSAGRSLKNQQCDINICAAVCEYGFKNDHNGCPSCECSDPCEGYMCPTGSHCEVAKDQQCTSGSSLCASVPVCQPDLVYSNPCDFGTPLVDNATGEALFCRQEKRHSRKYQIESFFDEDQKEARFLQNYITCPESYLCTKLYKQSKSVCCPNVAKDVSTAVPEQRPQSMCEYLRDFSDRMEGTEDGMKLALQPPKCETDGSYVPQQCSMKKIQVSALQKRQILEQDMVRQMKKMLGFRKKRDIYDNESLHLHKVENGENKTVIQTSRAAKIIDSKGLYAFNDNLLSNTQSKGIHIPPPLIKNLPEDMIEVEVEECWCVDNFGTEIPNSRGENVTLETCSELRKTLECLDITCRMGCEYGFVLDIDTKCPTCSCRDPCDGVICGDKLECRTVEVSCEEEYCPPVPACLPRKPGQCPYLVPPATENADNCAYACRSDFHCEGAKRCCSNGCGTQCVEPQLKTMCQHLRAVQLHQVSELGIRAKQTFIVECDEITGKFKDIQCTNGSCWCVNSEGQEISGTRVHSRKPECFENSAYTCPQVKCPSCTNGYKVDSNGCSTCDCRDLCDDIICSANEECQHIEVECIDKPCQKLPVCVPKRDTVCPEGEPLRLNGEQILCGPQYTDTSCPTTHTCQLGPSVTSGFCCSKTRDVCFASLDDSCFKNKVLGANRTFWTFSPSQNKCVPLRIGDNECNSKNLFHSEAACKAVCPVLTQCERLKLKNNLAAKRSGQSSVWFHPRCDPTTGHWSAVQCLGTQPSFENLIYAKISEPPKYMKHTQDASVCWCSDKKGAPLRGTLTRNGEPICNHRQARKNFDFSEGLTSDILMEELIRQMTSIAIEDDEISFSSTEFERIDSNLQEVTLNNGDMTNAELVLTPSGKNVKRLAKFMTRCEFLRKTAQFSVNCDENGQFVPIQCSADQCWCVDEAGNQLPSTTTFKFGTKNCINTPIESVKIQLILLTTSGQKFDNVYDVLKVELTQLINNVPENLRVQETPDGHVKVSFELHEKGKVDVAFKIEQLINGKNVFFGNGQLKPDMTLSRFTYRRAQLPVSEPTVLVADNTFQTAIFVLATGSAFLISIFVVFIMLKRGRRKVLGNSTENRVLGAAGDKYLDFNAPIFVLKADEKSQSKNKLVSKTGEEN